MVDYQTIKRQVDEVISYSQGIADPQTEELLQKWMKAKEFYIEKFGGLTHEVGPIQIHLDEDTKQNMLDEFLDTIANVYQNYIKEETSFTSPENLELFNTPRFPPNRYIPPWPVPRD